MKKFLIIAAAILLAAIFVSCNSSNTKTAVATKQDSVYNAPYDSNLANLQKSLPPNEGNAPIVYPDIKVGEVNFDKLCKFIGRYGFSIPEEGAKSDFQYSFRDSRGNRHAFVIIRREGDKPSSTGKVIQISVWAYAKGIKNQKHFFGYIITRDKISPLTRELDGNWKYYEDVVLGYNEFLAKVQATK